MTAKLFKVTVSKDVYVMADDQEAAEKMAIANVNADLSKWQTFTFLINSCSQLPDHVLGAFFWGLDEDVTIQQFLTRQYGGMELQ
jgi:hypothetical protein